MKRYILHVVEVVLHLIIIVAVTKFYYSDSYASKPNEPEIKSISTDNIEGGTNYGF